jgi:3-phenylpropionate/cinnamic acid dioxygenase small subunit
MSPRDACDAVQDILAREGRALDERRWDDWIALYREDAQYWVPAWKSESEPTADPDSELSLIYYASRRGLEERVMRIRSGKSLASTPLHRTAHFVSNVLVDEVSDTSIDAVATFQVNIFDPRSKQQHVFFGHYSVHLVREQQTWLIGRKKTQLLNDYIPTMLDVYCL